MHAKTMIVDGQLAYLGSIDLQSASSSDDRERLEIPVPTASPGRSPPHAVRERLGHGGVAPDEVASGESPKLPLTRSGSSHVQQVDGSPLENPSARWPEPPLPNESPAGRGRPGILARRP